MKIYLFSKLKMLENVFLKALFHKHATDSCLSRIFLGEKQLVQEVNEAFIWQSHRCCFNT